eukprot:497467-Pelagomonas_calceolata.AAC.2
MNSVLPVAVLYVFQKHPFQIRPLKAVQKGVNRVWQDTRPRKTIYHRYRAKVYCGQGTLLHAQLAFSLETYSPNLWLLGCWWNILNQLLQGEKQVNKFLQVFVSSTHCAACNKQRRN